MKEGFAFSLKALGILLLLYLLHQPLMQAYESALGRGISLFPSSQLIPPGDFYNSSYCLLAVSALLLTTPGLTWKRRSQMLISGLTAYLALDFASFLLWVTPPEVNFQGQAGQHIYTLLWKALGQWVLPLLLWLIAVRRQIKDMFSVLPSRGIAALRQ